MSIKNDIIKEYIDFTKIYDEERIINSNKKEAIEKTIVKCINSNVLKDYLQDNRWEVINIMDLLYDQDFIKRRKKWIRKNFALQVDEQLK